MTAPHLDSAGVHVKAAVHKYCRTAAIGLAKTMLTDQQLADFLTSRTIYVFNPDSGERVATADYLTDGTVRMRHADGRRDHGTWGVEGGMYWTQYKLFRDGTRNRFYLELQGSDTAQAYFSDGRRAFLQSHDPAGPGAA